MLHPEASQPATPEQRPAAGRHDRVQVVAALLVLGLISLCAFTYEFLLSAQHGYLTGNSLQNIIVNMVTMIVAMGLGQFASRWVNWQEMGIVRNELLVALVGGNANIALYAVWIYFGEVAGTAALLYSMLLGGFIGLQYPLFIRIISRMGVELKSAVAWVALADYLPAIPAALLYIYILKGPGMVIGSYLVGMVNVVSACLALYLFWEAIAPRERQKLGLLAGVVLATLVLGFVYGSRAVTGMEQQLYDHLIVRRVQTPYQRIVVTRGGREGQVVRLFLNGNLQFNSVDEYRYHEALVHPALAVAGSPERVLILGGGDGLAVREVLKWPTVREVVLVDIDPAITEMARTDPLFTRFNEGVLGDPRVRVVNEDAFKWVERGQGGLFDAVIVDLPDPNHPALAKLYSREFYSLVRMHLAPGGSMVVQSTSPYGAREAFWTIVRTIEAAGFRVHPYHALVPSFGDWGFTLATLEEVSLDQVTRWPEGVTTRFLTPETAAAMFVFPPDVRIDEVRISTLIQPTVITAYLKAWQDQWN